MLAVPPPLGLLAIWSIGHRQERLLVGKWETGQTNPGYDGAFMDTISFQGDGSYERKGLHTVYDYGHPNTEPHIGDYREWGRWYFAGQNHLVMSVEGKQSQDKPVQPPGVCATSLTDEDSVVVPSAPGGEISFDAEGDTAHVDGSLGPGGPIWKRIDKPVAD